MKKWVDRFQAEGPGGLERPVLAGRGDCDGRPPGDGRADHGAAPPAPAPASRSPPRPASRARRSAASSAPSGLSRMRDLEPPAPVIRYERKQPGEMIHLDIKKLGRFEQVGHRITGERTGQSTTAAASAGNTSTSAIDDASRIAFCPDHARREEESAVAFLEGRPGLLRRASASRVARVMTDNGSVLQGLRLPRRLPRSRAQTHPHQALHPQDQRQGRALHPDRLREWAYAQAYPTSADASRRAAHLAASLQLASTTRRDKIPNAHQPSRPRPRTTC